MDNATIISLISLCVAAFTAGWTVYRDAVQKPRFKVSIGLKSIWRGDQKDGPHIFIEALNVGPLPNRIGLVFARGSWWQRKIKRQSGAMIMPDFSHVAATESGKRIDVGDTAMFVIPLTEECFLAHDFADVGVSDGYGNLHWVPRKNLHEVRKSYSEH